MFSRTPRFSSYCCTPFEHVHAGLGMFHFWLDALPRPDYLSGQL